jgi:hypothetical protein
VAGGAARRSKRTPAEVIAELNGLMLGWTLGGYPSPNLEVVAALAGEVAGEQRPGDKSSSEVAMEMVARRRFGPRLAPGIVRAWREFSAALSQFPFHGSLAYNAPLQFGPSNLLWGEPTGYQATMIGFPYDDLEGWRAVYPAEGFIAQFDKISAGFDQAIATLKLALQANQKQLQIAERRAAAEELNVAEAVHFRSTANQARFVITRRALARRHCERIPAKPKAAVSATASRLRPTGTAASA